MKALRLPVSEKKNFEDRLLCSCVPTCDPPPAPGAGSVFTQEHQMNKLWKKTTRKCHIPNIKAPGLPVSKKNNFFFFFFFLCSYVPTCDPWDGASCDPRDTF